jgi:6-phosphogluconolactonase
MRLVVHSDAESLARDAAIFVTGLLEQATGPRASLGLAGGSTPKATYEQLRWQPVDWEAVDLWLSDERWVPPDDPESNGRMAASALTDHVDARMVRPRWSEYLTARDSAAFYEAELRRIIPGGRSDVILLGMGTDGHTASLFPDTEALREMTRWFVANEVPQVESWRLTATAPMIWRARTVVVLTAGEAKAAMVAEAFEGEDGTIPIQLLRRAEGDVVWLVDEAAARDLTRTPVDRPTR